jgi:hypothetical protein
MIKNLLHGRHKLYFILAAYYFSRHIIPQVRAPQFHAEAKMLAL